MQTFSDTSVVTDTGVSLTQLPVNLVCFGLKTILVLSMMCWEVLLLLTFCLLCMCKYFDDPFPGEMTDTGSSAREVESVTYGQ